MCAVENSLTLRDRINELQPTELIDMFCWFDFEPLQSSTCSWTIRIRPKSNGTNVARCSQVRFKSEKLTVVFEYEGSTVDVLVDIRLRTFELRTVQQKFPNKITCKC